MSNDIIVYGRAENNTQLLLCCRMDHYRNIEVYEIKFKISKIRLLIYAILAYHRKIRFVDMMNPQCKFDFDVLNSVIPVVKEFLENDSEDTSGDTISDEH